MLYMFIYFSSVREEDIRLLDVLEQLEDTAMEDGNHIDLDSTLAPLSQMHGMILWWVQKEIY